MPASRFLKYTGRNWPNPVCSFYWPVSTSRDDLVSIFNKTLLSKARTPFGRSRAFQNGSARTRSDAGASTYKKGAGRHADASEGAIADE